MKLTKSILREMIKDVLSEADIMDKEIKNPKTGNMIKVKTAIQLPDEHPANKKAKEMLAKSGEVGGPSYPNVPKKKPKEKPNLPLNGTITGTPPYHRWNTGRWPGPTVPPLEQALAGTPPRRH